MTKQFITLLLACMSSLTICNAQKLLPIDYGSFFEPAGAVDIEFFKKGSMLLSPIFGWNEGDSYIVYFSEPVPTSGVKISGQVVPKGAKTFQSSKPTSLKDVHWEAANGQEFGEHAVTIDMSSDSPVKLHISEIMVYRESGVNTPSYYCTASFNKRDSISYQTYSKHYHWEADNGEEFEQFVEFGDKLPIKAEYSYTSGKVVFYSPERFIGGTKWASESDCRAQYRLKLYKPTPSDHFAWKYVTVSGETQYQKIDKNVIVSTLNVDEAVAECRIVMFNLNEDDSLAFRRGNYTEELEIQELSLIDGSQPKFETLVLWHANGKTTEISLSKKPQIQFAPDKVLVKGTGINFEYSLSDIVKFTYKKEDIINDIDNPTNQANFTRDNEKIVFTGIKSTDEVALYKLNGSRVNIQLNAFDDNLVLPLSSIPQGIYLLRINNQTFKIIKK